MKHASKDRAFKLRIIERDGSCIACGETDQAQLCAHHLITRANIPVRFDPRNAVTVCNAPRYRRIHGVGKSSLPCHELAEIRRPWFEALSIRHFIELGYFKTDDEAVRFYGAARSSQPFQKNPWARGA